MKITEKQLNRIIREAVEKVTGNGNTIIGKFAEAITGLDENTANFIAQECFNSGGKSFMEFICNHAIGYGYNSNTDVYGNKLTY